jgi:HSP20 family protein
MLWDPFLIRGIPDPESGIRRMQDDINRLLGSFGAGAAESADPPLAVWADDTTVVVHAPLAGVDADALDLSIEGQSLTISGERAAYDEPSAGDRAWRRERQRGRFSRQIRLPFPVEASDVKARCQNGMLELSMPRSARDRPVRIQVTAS